MQKEFLSDNLDRHDCSLTLLRVVPLKENFSCSFFANRKIYWMIYRTETIVNYIGKTLNIESS